MTSFNLIRFKSSRSGQAIDYNHRPHSDSTGPVKCKRMSRRRRSICWRLWPDSRSNTLVGPGTRRVKRRCLCERATPKVKVRQTDVRVLFAREIFTRFFGVAKLLKLLVAKDGIEPPTPAFSGPLTESLKWFEIVRTLLRLKGLCNKRFRMA